MMRPWPEQFRAASLFVIFAGSTVLLGAPVAANRNSAQTRSPVREGQQRVIGLLELPRVFGLDDSDAAPASQLPLEKGPIKVYSAPSAAAAVIREIARPEEVEAREHGYEALSAVAYQRRNGWYLIGLDGNTKGWIAPRDAGRFRPLEGFYKDHLNYLTGDWDGRLRVSPRHQSRAQKFRAPRTDEGNDFKGHVEVSQVKRVGGELWLRIKVLRESECTAVGPPKVLARGWIPAYSRSGRPNVWFFSRGC